MIEKADKILSKYEDDNEYHFHKCDREWIMKAMVELAESEVKKLTIHDVMASVSDELLLRAGKYEDEANADFDTDGVQHNLNIGRYDGLMQAVQEINKHLP